MVGVAGSLTGAFSPYIVRKRGRGHGGDVLAQALRGVWRLRRWCVQVQAERIFTQGAYVPAEVYGAAAAAAAAMPVVSLHKR